MINNKFRKALDKYSDENDINPIIFDSPSYDNSIIYITSCGNLVYSFTKMVKEFMKDNKCDETEAIEFIEYNTIRAINYNDEYHPIIVEDTPKSIIEKYGE